MTNKGKGRAGCNQATLSTSDLNAKYTNGGTSGTRISSGTASARADNRQCPRFETPGFLDAIRSAGLEPPTSIEPGLIQRFPGLGKRPGNRAAWCILFEDRQAGCFGDWSSGIEGIWRSDRIRPLSVRERRAIAEQAARTRENAEKARRARQLESARRAARIWASANPAPPDYPYLDRKRVQPHGSRTYRDALCLPITDFRRGLQSLQFISASGAKRLLSGGRKQGCFIPVSGRISRPDRVVICEGWATGCTLAESEAGWAVLAAIDAGNLQPVAVAARHRWPSAELVIAGDDDRLTPGNPGATKAREAAIAANALLALPQWPADAPEHLSDFNDLAIWLAGGDT